MPIISTPLIAKSYAAQRLDNDVDLNETRKIIHLDVGI